MKTVKRFIPLIIGILILITIALLAPWNKVIPLITDIPSWSLFAMLALSLGYYAAKSYRFWVMLRLLGIRKPLHQVSMIYMAAQPVSVLPGGELYRTVLLEKELGVPVRTSASTVTLQGLVEAVVLLGFSLAGAFVLGKDRGAILVVAMIVAILIAALQQGWLEGGHRILNKLPFIQISKRKYDRFVDDHQKLLTGKTLGIVVGLSFIPVLCGIGIFYIAAHAVGARISLSGASIGYCLPVVLSGISFLPGGVGASEGGTIGILKLINVATAATFAITLLIRIFTLGAGMLYGLIALLIMHTTKESQ